MFTQVIAAIIAFCKSISALRWLAEALERWDKARNENVARKRLDEKDAAVDSGIDAISRLHPPKVEQQRPPDEAPGLPNGGQGGSGMVPRRTENDKQVGI